MPGVFNYRRHLSLAGIGFRLRYFLTDAFLFSTRKVFVFRWVEIDGVGDMFQLDVFAVWGNVLD